MKTVLETLKSGSGYLEKHGVEKGRLNMQWLLAEVLDCDRMEVYLQFDRPLEESELVKLRELVRRRSGGEPLQYILGWIEFHGLRFVCDKRALVPRPETEELVALILQHPEWVPDGGLLADVGCGSGVIALCLASVWRDRGIRVHAFDISTEALELAGENRRSLDLDEPVELRRNDLLGGVDDEYALIAANLPYIQADEMAGLEREVRHDPPLALNGGADGLDLVRKLVDQAPSRLSEGGRLILEIGYDQGAAVQRLIENNAGFSGCILQSDLSGHPRFIIAEC